MKQSPWSVPPGLWLIAWAWLAGCGVRPAETAPPGAPGSFPLVAAAREMTVQPSSPLVPVTARDAVWGEADAPVTLVGFFDAECVFCQRVWPAVIGLAAHYGPSRLRLVIKHHPLPFHSRARPAAVAAQLVLESRGPRAFMEYYTGVMASAADEAFIWRAALKSGVDPARLQAGLSLRSDPAQRKIDDDVALAGRLGLAGTPAFMLNGHPLRGALPLEQLVAIIQAELGAARELLAAGVPPSAVYPSRVAANRAADAEPAESTRYRVDLAGSPMQGPRDALVTIVEFVDLECPFCKRAESTMQEVLRRYPGRVRRIVKHHALPFHPRALPAAMLALEARAQRGDAAHFEAMRLVLASSPKLEHRDLLAIARQLRLDPARVERALARETHRATAERDAEQAEALDARGTPHFFINGLRVSGAQPIENFVAVIEAELALAQRLLDQGVARARLYDELMKGARLPPPPPPPELKPVAPPTAANPTRGPAGAPIVIQIFGDFACRYCGLVQKTLSEVDRAFPAQIRWVWRNFPLPSHGRAREAAMAALEAYAQQGSRGFWRMHDRLFAAQAEAKGLERAALLGYAVELGLDRRRFEAALADHRHEASLLADERVARDAGVNGTPGFVVNGYWLSGAQPLGAFKKLIDYARRHPVPAPPTPPAPVRRPGGRDQARAPAALSAMTLPS